MSLKGGIQNPSKWTTEFLDTVEDARKGKKKAINKLSEYAQNGSIGAQEYNKLLIECRINKDKKDRELKRKIKRALCIIAALAVMLSSTESALDYLVDAYDAESAVFYLFLYVCAILYAFAYDPNSDKLSKLERENEQLKDNLDTYKNVNKKLEAELNNMRNNS